MTQTLTRRGLLQAATAAATMALLPRTAVVVPAMQPCLDFAIAGGAYHGLGAALRAGLPAGAALTLRREPDNPHDANAVAVHGPDGTRLGYVPRHANPSIAAAMDAGRAVTAEVLGPITDDAEAAGDFAFTG